MSVEPVRFLDLAAAYDELREELDEAWRRVASSGQYILGPEVAAFEREFADYCEASEAVGVSSGLEALRIVLDAWEIGRGDEVIVPANTFISTWFAVSQVGARPVPVEPDEATFNIDPAAAAAAITPRTRVLIPVHLYGLPADMDPLLEIAERHGLLVLEDAAQAHGARYRGRRAGSMGHAAAFSFYAGKNLGALGEAGAVVTSDRALAERVRILRDVGSRRKYDHELRGTNARIDALQAALVRVKLRRLDEWNARRRALAERYLERLAGTGAGLPSAPDWAEHAWHLFVIRHPERDRLAEALREAGVETIIHYPVPPHLSGAYSDMQLERGALPVTEQLADEVLSLPIGPHLDFGQVDRVADLLSVCVRSGAETNI